MLRFLVQNVTPTGTPTSTPTPLPTSTDLNDYLGGMVASVLGFNNTDLIVVLLRGAVVWLLIVWLVFAFWVAFDAMQRYKNQFVALLWFIFVLPFNFLGLLGYIFIRPSLTIEEKEWTKLEAKYLMYELSNVNDCPSCKTMVPAGSNYCPVCGYQMNVTCANCNSIQSIYNMHCVQCGSRLREDDKLQVEVEPQSVSQTSTKRTNVADTVLNIVNKVTKSIGETAKNVRIPSGLGKKKDTTAEQAPVEKTEESISTDEKIESKSEEKVESKDNKEHNEHKHDKKK
jgi:predicted RNA-binding Zn-ribbon protein involved in translation (DUF1610 family)